ncbi:MAG: tRNA lysidine(34) synthetase TilS [Candidatus Nanopelagicales bacterium]
MTELPPDRRWATPATLETRAAVQSLLGDLRKGDRILVACSGGPDSLALAAAAQFVGSQLGLEVGAVIVDHQLQERSAEVAADAGQACVAFGLDPVVVAAVDVTGPGGPEAAARRARYDLLEAMAVRLKAKAVLLGHTREDQAETVLLRIARGSGTRTLAAMQSINGIFRRPLLNVSRSVVHASAADEGAALGLVAWQDPHNSDPRFTRVRVRNALDRLEDALGPGLVAGLARTAELAHEDALALEGWADRAFEQVVTFHDEGMEAAVGDLEQLPKAVRTRILRRMCLDMGAPTDAITFAHVQSLDEFIVNWHGQGAISLPARVSARRRYGRLILTAPDSTLDAGDPVAT